MILQKFAKYEWGYLQAPACHAHVWSKYVSKANILGWIEEKVIIIFQ